MIELHVAFMLQTVGTLFLVAGGFTGAILAMLVFVRSVYESFGGDAI